MIIKGSLFEEATFGAGCFWHVEEAFRGLDGVVETEVGFMGGIAPNPTYEQVCTHTTGHAEVVHVRYNPTRISYDELLKKFWDIHDPTQLNRQGPDVGDQYRSVIFYHTQEQHAAAEKSKIALEHAGKYKGQIVTAIAPAEPLYRAEEYHQKYLAKRGLSSCPI